MHPVVKSIYWQLENFVGLSYVFKVGRTHNNFSLSNLVLVSMLSSDVNKESNFVTSSRGTFNFPKDGKVFISREGEIQTSGKGNFREKLFAEGLSKDTVDLITSESRIADVVGNKLIPLVAWLLAELFLSGLECNTIPGYRSSVSRLPETHWWFFRRKPPLCLFSCWKDF